MTWINDRVEQEKLDGYGLLSEQSEANGVRQIPTAFGFVFVKYARRRRAIAFLEIEQIGCDSPYSIKVVYVDRKSRRRGIASELLRIARDRLGVVNHSNVLTRDGRRWMEADILKRLEEGGANENVRINRLVV